ncbi:hypothetical protein FHX09_005480 [Rhizobium sp. BK538]|nr:hypothetical protein [Rhizobium sp. BK060]MBB4171586.1 hypothetical protein [Rhizobium sp. BK538]TCM71151.1 hypothetical protein EV291_1233 [Rhizobium sp. BK068]
MKFKTPRPRLDLRYSQERFEGCVYLAALAVRFLKQCGDVFRGPCGPLPVSFSVG